MDIFRLVLVGLILLVLLAFRFRPDKSRFEINRLAEHSAKYKSLAKFLDIYLGLMVLVRILALMNAILLVIFAAFSWGLFGGGAIAFAVILVIWFLGSVLHGAAETLIGKHLGFFNRYLTWTSVLGRLSLISDEPRISSEHELMHLVKKGDFLDDQTKILLEKALAFRDQTVDQVMTPRDHIEFLQTKDALTPKLLDELYSGGHKIFPVVQGNLDRTVGLLYLDDVLPIEQHEKNLSQTMRKCPPPIETGAPLGTALNQMCEYHSTTLLVVKNEKIVGMVTLKDITRRLFSA
ncbi:CBS domain-containing protein [Candidatus Saccharibacteria bacterium]|nr:CBS domain-containing protein [Candidatus Saccharibacteria bacterium]